MPEYLTGKKAVPKVLPDGGKNYPKVGHNDLCPIFSQIIAAKVPSKNHTSLYQNFPGTLQAPLPG